ncbi:SIS domain-containing protein [Clostridium tyrobutyricum]|nr:SIS domain-containing protein [Clostridium tyrobutyricum]MBV4426299.1 SIS domain-containing protein [Clostridium tyrobutyricum]
MAKQDDVIMAFSNSDSNKELIDAIKIGIKNGVKVISITGNAKSPISKVSDIVLVSYGRKSSFRSEAMQC